MENLKYFTPREEYAHIQDVYGEPPREAYEIIKSHLQILQARSQTIMGLCTICLTITGFSGPRIAESGRPAAASVVGGLFFVVLTTLLLVAGPLRLQWITSIYKGSDEETLIFLLARRNRRTRLFTAGSLCLIIGMALYMLGLGLYLFSF